MTTRPRYIIETAMSEHTPGPWVQFCDHGRTIAIMPAGRPGAICKFTQKCGPTIANARLIAAAPDMLAALKYCVIERSEWLTEARAAIAKAEGRA